ncbi:right-handed parallel beta-helix repeat-containing protein [Paramicrobacterium humi]|uniref:right-handed parallel beta-helix repeat-containing protein n=1 Tax=Paramicrobacterium humi TaxID=640635 RepID=UPI001C409645|nr:right-handed parallel beta-helix repeat-containing protein [Microbacterium humi]
MYATLYGVIADGRADDSKALNNALKSAAADRRILVLPAKSTVALKEPLLVPTNARLNMNGSTLMSYVTGNQASVQISSKSNVHIHDGRIDWINSDDDQETEWRHGIALLGCSNVRLENLVISNHRGDGIYIGAGAASDVGEQLASNSEIVISGVHCLGNHRQGMSLVTASGVYVSESSFRGTNGTHPQSGVDLEPNTDVEVLENVNFNGCTFSDNSGFGLAISTRAEPQARQSGFTFVSCHFEKNAKDGIYLHNAQGAAFLGTFVKSNGGSGVRLASSELGSTKHINFTSATFANNGEEGAVLAGAFEDLAFMGCRFENNSDNLASKPPHFGLDINPTRQSRDLRLIGNRITGQQQRGSLRTGSMVLGLTLIGNAIVGTAGSAVDLNDDRQTRVEISSASSNLAGTVRITPTSPGSTAVEVRAPGEEYPRLSVNSAGISFGSGEIQSDVSFFRDGPNLLKSDGKLVAGKGLGVGNSSEGHELGVLIKKIEVFDAAGRSLGFIPIFDSIS